MMEQQTEFEAKLIKTNEYLAYLQRHYDNVQKAWTLFQEFGKKLPVVYDDCRYRTVNYAIKDHDLSKFF